MFFDNSFGQEEKTLRDAYPNEPLFSGLISEGDRSFWYSGDVLALYASDTYPTLPQHVRSVGAGDSAPYWKPPDELKAHMRAVAAKPQSKDRLFVPNASNKKSTNPNFERFPVGYHLRDPSLSQFVIADTIRVRSMSDEQIEVERANYLDQLATNIRSDETPRGMNVTLRQHETASGCLAPFRPDSWLANTLGSALTLVDKFGFPVLRYRGRPDTIKDRPNARLAVMAEGWHCAASGVMTWQDLDWSVQESDRDSKWLVSGMETGMWRVLKDETELTREDGITMHPIAFARELKRAGKPNFFFVAQATEMTRKDIQRKIESRNPPDADGFKKGEITTQRTARLLSAFTVLIKDILGDPTPVSFYAPDHLHLGSLAQSKSKAFENFDTTGFTYENYGALSLAATWWRETRGTL